MSDEGQKLVDSIYEQINNGVVYVFLEEEIGIEIDGSLIVSGDYIKHVGMDEQHAKEEIKKQLVNLMATKIVHGLGMRVTKQNGQA